MSAERQNSIYRLKRHEKLILISGAVTAVFWLVFSINRQAAEIVYGQTIYPPVKWLIALFEFTIPLPGYLIFWPFVAIATFMLLFKAFPKATFGNKLLIALKRLSLFLILLIVWFYWSWGFNYYRLPFHDKAGLEIGPVEPVMIEEMGERCVTQLNGLRAMTGPVDRLETKEWQAKTEPLVRELLGGMDYATAIPVRIVLMRPPGLMMRWSAAGMYLPFSGESTVDAGLLPVQVPFVLAHETAHAFGVTDEGACNFLAFVACMNSRDEVIRYSAWLALYRYLAWELKKLDEEAYDQLKAQLSQGVRDDMLAIYENGKRFPDLIPVWRDMVYDNYLKSQGVSAGTASYDEVVMLLASYYSDTPLGDQLIRTEGVQPSH